MIYAIGVEFRKGGDNWRFFADNSVDFVCDINDFPLELKKSYVDQLCEMDAKVREYVYNASHSQKLSKLLQELAYIKV